MKERLKKNKWIILGVVAGGIAGYVYYYCVGCASGTCAITSKPLNSTLYGMLMGGLLVNLFSGRNRSTNNH